LEKRWKNIYVSQIAIAKFLPSLGQHLTPENENDGAGLKGENVALCLSDLSDSNIKQFSFLREFICF
jgi:hypothetical protein